MANTTAHTPYRAWFFTSNLLLEAHDHTHSGCDLPSPDRYAQLQAADGQPQHLSCHYVLDVARMPPLCGCQLCSGRFKPASRRRARHTAQRICRTVERDPYGSWDDQLPSFEPFNRPLAAND